MTRTSSGLQTSDGHGMVADASSIEATAIIYETNVELPSEETYDISADLPGPDNDFLGLLDYDPIPKSAQDWDDLLLSSWAVEPDKSE